MEKIDLVIEMLKSAQAENERRFDEIERRLDRIDIRLGRLEDKMQVVYDARDKVKIEFGWQWSLVSLVLVVMGVTISHSLSLMI